MISWLINEDELEKYRQLNLPLLVSLPDTGLISHIAGGHIISELKLKYIGYVDAEWIPPFIAFVNGKSFPPIRIYADNKIMVYFSEIPLDNIVWRFIALSIYELYERIRPSMILGGIGLPYMKRQEITDRNMLRVFIGGHNIESIPSKGVKEYVTSVKSFTGGLYGVYATIIQAFSKKKIPIIIHVIDSFPYFPDIDASIIYLLHLSRMLNITIDITALEEKASQIKLLARSMMKQIQTQMSSQQPSPTGTKPMSSIYM